MLYSNTNDPHFVVIHVFFHAHETRLRESSVIWRHFGDHFMLLCLCGYTKRQCIYLKHMMHPFVGIMSSPSPQTSDFLTAKETQIVSLFLLTVCFEDSFYHLFLLLIFVFSSTTKLSEKLTHTFFVTACMRKSGQRFGWKIDLNEREFRVRHKDRQKERGSHLLSGSGETSVPSFTWRQNQWL